MAADKSTIEHLASVELFRRCSPKDLEALAGIVDDLAVPAGTVLCDQGRVADDCYVVRDGQADVSVGGQVVATVGPGESIGEMALLDHLPRSATVTARTPMHLYVIGAARFNELLDSGAIARALLEQLSLRVRDLEVGRGRLASY
ncbi:MAG TPA: cyclic nucleotide-binding domain-containing protein [Acidimicrobiales bacterium]|nr:cyclic nucleotide-binding domain-containing protein [Acidimicrobiales bacterium]